MSIGFVLCDHSFAKAAGMQFPAISNFAQPSQTGAGGGGGGYTFGIWGLKILLGSSAIGGKGLGFVDVFSSFGRSDTVVFPWGIVGMVEVFASFSGGLGLSSLTKDDETFGEVGCPPMMPKPQSKAIVSRVAITMAPSIQPAFPQSKTAEASFLLSSIFCGGGGFDNAGFGLQSFGVLLWYLDSKESTVRWPKDQDQQTHSSSVLAHTQVEPDHSLIDLNLQLSLQINTELLQKMDHPVTLQEERKVWTIHQSVNGTTYYYNRATKKSQYEMPECFKTTEEVLEHPDWKEYRTAEGKKFYYNAATRKSCWQLPNEVKEYRIKLEEKRRKDKEEGKLVEEEPLSEAEEIKRKFMALLKQKFIGANTKWDSCIKLCEDDDRWQLLKISDKKKYFNEYIGELKKISDQEKKAKTEVNRVQFTKMLKENGKLTSECKMHKVAYDFMADPRWRLLQEHERENAFQAYLDQLAQKERDQANKIKEQNSEKFKQLLEADCVKYNTKWDDVRIQYKNNEIFKALHPYDRISAFTDYIFQAEKKNEEEVAKERRLRERVNRIAFRSLLREKLLSGELTYKSKWKDFLLEFRYDQRLLNMFDPSQPGTSAHEIFEHFMYEVREKHKLIKGSIKHHFKKIGFKMTEETTSEEFKTRAQTLPQYMELKDYLQDYFHRYFQLKIKSKKESKLASAKKSSKKQRKIIFKIFKHLQLKDLLKNKYSIESQMQYVEKSMKGLGYTITHEAIFKYYLAFLERNEQEQKGRSRSSSSDSGKKKRKHKIEEIEDEQEFASSLRKFTIPELNELKQQQANEVEEEGQIKDDSRQSQKKKKSKSKKKKRSSSSDSD